MNFLYPQFLFGFFALSIPIIVHLFNFRKTRKIQFSNNLFLKFIKETSTAKRKLKHYLTLAARLLFITFLVMAFAQPYLPGLNEKLNNNRVYIYLDNSFSMSNQIATDLSAFDEAIRFIDELVELYPPNTRYKLLTNEFQSGSNVLKSRDEIRDEIAEISLSGISRSLEEVNNRLLKEIYEDERGKKDIYLLTDFQKSTIGDLQKLEADSNGFYYIVPLSYATPANVYIDSLYLTNPFLLDNEKNELIISFNNAGPESADELPVKLFINQNQVANTTLSIPENGSATATFELNLTLDRINLARVSFEEFPVTFDNDFYFTLNVDDRVNILEIKSNNVAQHIGNVYANKKLFNFVSYPIDNLNYNSIAQSDLIILNELRDISASLMDLLMDFASNNGTICIIPSEDTNVDSFRPLLSFTCKKISGEPEKMPLRSLDLSDPFFANMFVESNDVFEMPLAVNTANTLVPNRTILSLRNREPFLSKTVGEKNIFFFSSPFKDRFTNFHFHAIFVPVMYRIASLSNVISDDLYYSLNQSIVSLNVDSVEKNVIFKLRNQEQELIPAQRIVGREVILELPKNTMSPGYYEVMNGEKTLKLLSFNYDRNESKMAQFSYEELYNEFENKQNISVYESENNNNFTQSLKELHSGIPLWKYMIIIALIALLAEILIIRYL